jgi:hypothetical protein
VQRQGTIGTIVSSEREEWYGLRHSNRLTAIKGLSQDLAEGMNMTLDYIALLLLAVIPALLIYGLIAVWGIPYEIAKSRNHPHQDAIGAATWVSLFTLGALWPFLWIWAMAYRPERGWGETTVTPLSDLSETIRRFESRLSALELMQQKQVT